MTDDAEKAAAEEAQRVKRKEADRKYRETHAEEINARRRALHAEKKAQKEQAGQASAEGKQANSDPPQSGLRLLLPDPAPALSPLSAVGENQHSALAFQERALGPHPGPGPGLFGMGFRGNTPGLSQRRPEHVGLSPLSSHPGVQQSGARSPYHAGMGPAAWASSFPARLSACW